MVLYQYTSSKKTTLPNPFWIVPLPGDYVLKYMSLYGAIFIQAGIEHLSSFLNIVFWISVKNHVDDLDNFFQSVNNFSWCINPNPSPLLVEFLPKHDILRFKVSYQKA